MATAILRREDNGIEFYTVQSTGQSGMSQSGLSILAGVSQQAISKLEKTLTTKSISESLEPWMGKALTLITSKDDDCEINGTAVGNLSIYQSGFCSAVIQHYAFKGNKVAQYSLTKFSTSGIDSWIQKQTGWEKPNNDNLLQEQLLKLTGLVTNIALSVTATIERNHKPLPKATVDPVPGEIQALTERQCIVRLIRSYTWRKNQNLPLEAEKKTEQEVTRWMYRELKYRHNFDVDARFKKTEHKSKIDLIEAEGYLPQLHAICNHFLGN
jgi:hypothetical protein